MLVDRAVIVVRSGKGGDGAVSFRRAKYVPKGGPDGGDGGDGGSVYLTTTPGVDTLLDLAGRHHWIAGAGQPGGAKQCSGAKGRELDVPVPPGTLVYDDQTGRLIADLHLLGMRVPVARGGRGGFGNEHFKCATNQTPRQRTLGKPGQELTLRLELKLIADIGLVGMPNAGKSTLLSRVTQAKPKIGDYPFTTIEPNLGIVQLSGYRRMVIADVPGLIRGAAQGHGLGTAFLRHIERTRLLVHVLEVDPWMSDQTIENLLAKYRLVRKELATYSDQLIKKQEIVAVNKTDLLSPDEQNLPAVEALQGEIGHPVIWLSAVTGTGLNRLLEGCWRCLADIKQRELQLAVRASGHGDDGTDVVAGPDGQGWGTAQGNQYGMVKPE